MTTNKLEFERILQGQGYHMIAGTDEAGRGPLAGPVVAAAAIMNLQDLIEGVDDSKKISAKKRARLLECIQSQAIAFGVGIVDHEEIDRINILNAARLAMGNAVKAMDITPDYLLADAMKDIDVSCPQQSIIKGDLRSYSIAAASIIAKETRDAIMVEMDQLYPQYGFAQHKGYGTKQHREALLKYGPCPIHRRSFLRKILGDIE